MKLVQAVAKEAGQWARWIKAGQIVWYAMSTYAEKDIPKGAGFSWQKDMKLWFTGDRDKAAKLAEYATGDWGKELMDHKVFLTGSLAGSRQSVSYSSYPHPEGIDYYPFQRAGIDYMVKRNNTLLADDMGLGKTIQAIGLINVDDTIQTVLVICPKTLKLNWQREFERWLVRKRKIGQADTKICPLPEHGYDIVIVHYDAIGKINRQLSSVKWDLMIVDEAHYIKNRKTVRYKSILGDIDSGYVRIEAKRRVFATGTPICNYPSELWPLISVVDPQRWNDETFWYYHKRYCDVSNNGYGMNFKGAASEERLNELQIKLRETCMIRRLKSEVLTELPPKVRQVVELEYDEDDENVIRALAQEGQYYDRVNDREGQEELAARVELAKASDNDDEYRAAIERLSSQNKYAFEEMARIRHDTAVAKIPYAIEYVKGMLETVNKIVVFCHHRDVGDAFAKSWPLESVSIHGDVTPEDRQIAVDRFQDDPLIKLAIVSIKAGGVGITLTAASNEVFAELDWVPGNVTQAEDRCHRIGQSDVVNVYHLVLADSIDVKMARTIIEKQAVIEAALDKIAEIEPITVTRDSAATKSSSRKQIAEVAEKLTEIEILEIHRQLRYLAGNDRDWARAENGIGFNKIDGKIGHELADLSRLSPRQAALGQRVCKKYSKQLQEVA
jgi:SWI/SNF-related matrix-associated actin-dependent regulator 1 of chromatin subfamily A